MFFLLLHYISPEFIFEKKKKKDRYLICLPVDHEFISLLGNHYYVVSESDS